MRAFDIAQVGCGVKLRRNIEMQSWKLRRRRRIGRRKRKRSRIRVDDSKHK